MKKIITLLALFLGLFSEGQPLEKSLLWKISGNGLTKASYLFGTIHATCDAKLDAETIKALDETEQLYLEINMDDTSLQMQMMQGMIMKDGVTLSSLLNETDFNTIDTFLQKNIGMSAKMINNFKPFMINSMLLPKLLDCEFQSVEMELMKVTKNQNEKVFGLEKVTDQLAVFDKIPYKEQAEELVKTAKSNLEIEKAEFKKMMEIYRNKDIEAMLSSMETSENKISSEYQSILLNNRNKNWIPVIENAVRETATFFGVGAAHLAGEEGVIKLLRKKGYRVEAVK